VATSDNVVSFISSFDDDVILFRKGDWYGTSACRGIIPIFKFVAGFKLGIGNF